MSVPEGMAGLRSELAQRLCRADSEGLDAIDPFTDLADALLAPDGPLWPALRALGDMAAGASDAWSVSWLENIGITGPLADACFAAAEAQP